MENVILKVYDTTQNDGNQELLSDELSLETFQDPAHAGRRMIVHRGKNVGILNPDGSTEMQPGYVARVEQPARTSRKRD